MGWVSGIVVFTCFWWVFFFMILPFGVEQDLHPEKGHDAGAPKKPYLYLKVAITTAITILAWFIADYVITSIEPTLTY